MIGTQIFHVGTTSMNDFLMLEYEQGKRSIYFIYLYN
ncbi:MAG: hypothetical protein [Microvirus sp.]|nr:MAG: hypothetical protein [Microvirus sp.]